MDRPRTRLAESSGQRHDLSRVGLRSERRAQMARRHTGFTAENVDGALSEVSGSDVDGTPTGEYAAVAFPVQRGRWRNPERYIRAAAPLPPGFPGTGPIRAGPAANRGGRSASTGSRRATTI